MARIQFAEVNNLPDALDASTFEFLLGIIPNSGDSRELTLTCQQAALPGFSNEAFEVALHGYVNKYRGREMFERTLSVTYIERAGGLVYNRLANWHQYIVGSRTGNSGGYKRGPGGYSVDGAISVYDTIGARAISVVFNSLFLTEFPAITLDGTSSQSMQVQTTFSFDNITIDGVSQL